VSCHEGGRGADLSVLLPFVRLLKEEREHVLRRENMEIVCNGSNEYIQFLQLPS
jgi:hypothetical protein